MAFELLLSLRVTPDRLGSLASSISPHFTSLARAPSTHAHLAEQPKVLVALHGPREGGAWTWEWDEMERVVGAVYMAVMRELLSKGWVLGVVDVLSPEQAEQAGKGWHRTAEVSLWEQQEQEGGSPNHKQRQSKVYDVVALGGTFDHLHIGHKILLTLAAECCSQELIVGVTSTDLLKKKTSPEKLESLQERIEKVQQFLERLKPAIKHTVVEITDPYGPTKDRADIKALVVSEETYAGGLAVNKKRAENGLEALEVLSIGVVSHDASTASLPTTTTKAGETSWDEKMGSTAIRSWIVAQETGAP